MMTRSFKSLSIAAVAGALTLGALSTAPANATPLADSGYAEIVDGFELVALEAPIETDFEFIDEDVVAAQAWTKTYGPVEVTVVHGDIAGNAARWSVVTVDKTAMTVPEDAQDLEVYLANASIAVSDVDGTDEFIIDANDNWHEDPSSMVVADFIDQDVDQGGGFSVSIAGDLVADYTVEENVEVPRTEEEFEAAQDAYDIAIAEADEVYAATVETLGDEQNAVENTSDVTNYPELADAKQAHTDAVDAAVVARDAVFADTDPKLNAAQAAAVVARATVAGADKVVVDAKAAAAAATLNAAGAEDASRVADEARRLAESTKRAAGVKVEKAKSNAAKAKTLAKSAKGKAAKKSAKKSVKKYNEALDQVKKKAAKANAAFDAAAKAAVDAKTTQVAADATLHAATGKVAAAETAARTAAVQQKTADAAVVAVEQVYMVASAAYDTAVEGAHTVWNQAVVDHFGGLLDEAGDVHAAAFDTATADYDAAVAPTNEVQTVPNHDTTDLAGGDLVEFEAP